MSPSRVILATALIYTAGVLVLFGMSVYVGQSVVFLVVLALAIFVMVRVAGGYEAKIVERIRREAAKGAPALLWPAVTVILIVLVAAQDIIVFSLIASDSEASVFQAGTIGLLAAGAFAFPIWGCYRTLRPWPQPRAR